MTEKIGSEGSRRADLLAPFGRAWGKLMTAIEERVAGLSDEELLELITACQDGRRHGHLKGDSYWASFEVSRAAQTEKNRRGLH